jgi:hypothetical protein
LRGCHAFASSAGFLVHLDAFRWSGRQGGGMEETT